MVPHIIIYLSNPHFSHIIIITLMSCTHWTVYSQVITEVTEMLTPDKVNIIWSSVQFKEQCSLREEWFGTHYSSEGSWSESENDTIQGLFQGGPGRAFAPPMKVFAPLRNWLNLHIEFWPCIQRQKQ